MTPVNIDTCQCWHLSVFRPKLWTKNRKCFNFDEILYSKQIEGGEFNGDSSFLWFLTTVKFDTLNIGSCHLLSHIFKQELQELQFGEILYSAQIKDAEFNGDNNFLWFLMLVDFDLCQYWHLSCFRPQIWTKNGKCFNFDETLYSAQIEGAEFQGDNSFL